MKFMKWKSLAVTCAVCLLPILLGVALWGRLPEVMAVHFNLDNEPDGFASKGFVVFGLPVLMALLQTFCCFVNDWNAYRHGERKKFTRATKWIIPVMAVVIQVATLGYGLGWKLDIRRLVCFLVGAVLVVVGNYLPKFEGARIKEGADEPAKKAQRFIGFETVVMGLLFLISILFPPIVSLFCLFLFIPYVVVSILVGAWYVRRDRGGLC